MAESVRLHRHFYREDAVRATAEAYGELADVTVSPEGEEHLSVSFDNLDEDLGDEVLDAFCNHALYESIVRYREELDAAEDAA